jgi:polyferredoxin
MKRKMQITLQIAFLILFVFLLVIGAVQLWLGLFAAGLIVSLFFGRLYCGWVCPINTLASGITWLKRKLRIRSFNIPAVLKKPAVRTTMLGAFIAVFVFTMVSGRKLPVLPALLIIGSVLTLFFPEELWHAFLCPYGTLFHIVSRRPLRGMNINKASCTNCGICAKVCPAAAVDKEDGYYTIKGNTCLVCFDCATKCSQNAITYHRLKTTTKGMEYNGQKADG